MPFVPRQAKENMGSNGEHIIRIKFDSLDKKPGMCVCVQRRKLDSSLRPILAYENGIVASLSSSEIASPEWEGKMSIVVGETFTSPYRVDIWSCKVL